MVVVYLNGISSYVCGGGGGGGGGGGIVVVRIARGSMMDSIYLVGLRKKTKILGFRSILPAASSLTQTADINYDGQNLKFCASSQAF